MYLVPHVSSLPDISGVILVNRDLSRARSILARGARTCWAQRRRTPEYAASIVLFGIFLPQFKWNGSKLWWTEEERGHSTHRSVRTASAAKVRGHSLNTWQRPECGPNGIHQRDGWSHSGSTGQDGTNRIPFSVKSQPKKKEHSKYKD